MIPMLIEFVPRWFQSQFEFRLPIINSVLAGFLPILIFATVLLLIIRMISTPTSSLLMKGILLVSVSLMIGYATTILVDNPAAQGAFWLSLVLAGLGLVAVLTGVRSNPGRDTVLLLISGLLITLFSAYADLSIWIVLNVAQASCQPFPGVITCQPPNYSYPILLTLLWTIPGVLTVINSSVYLQKTRKEEARFLEKRRRAAAKEEARLKPDTQPSEPFTQIFSQTFNIGNQSAGMEAVRWAASCKQPNQFALFGQSLVSSA